MRNSRQLGYDFSTAICRVRVPVPSSPKVEKTPDMPGADVLGRPACLNRPSDGKSGRHHFELAKLFLDGYRREEFVAGFSLAKAMESAFCRES